MVGLAGLLLGALVLIPAAVAQESSPHALRTYIAAARVPWSRWPDFSADVDVVDRIYTDRKDAPLWLEGGGPSGPARQVIGLLLRAAEHGLQPDDYDAAQVDSLAALLGGSGHVQDRLRFDLLLTVAAARYFADLSRGRAPPASLSHSLPNPRLDVAAALTGAVDGDSVERLEAAIIPQLAQYRNLQREAARYRALSDSLLPPLQPSPLVRPGDPYDGAAVLARRLAALGDLPAGGPPLAADEYSGELVEAIRRFQRRHGLAPDGVLGRHTFAALTAPFEQRGRQIELAMERLRWLPPIAGQRFIVVNIPAFRLFAFDSVGGPGTPSLNMRVIVGKALSTRTPVLVEQLRYLEFQPYWNVPRSILLREIVPMLRRRPAYLREHDMDLIGPGERVVGDRVTPEVLAALTSGELRVRQRPSPRNPLGRVKFVLPNAADVYLHGTPDTALFTQRRRDFSHGCIRVREPAALATWVLHDQAAWPADSVDVAMTARRTRRVLLSRPMPVVLFYTTAVAAPQGGIAFYEDIYGHDRQLDQALRAGPTPP